MTSILITLRIPEKMLSALHQIQSLDNYESRSEVIREAIQDFLNDPKTKEFF